MAYIGNPIVSTDFPVDYFSGNGSTTAFTLSIAPASVNSLDVQISGVAQSPQTYTVSGTTLTFTASPPTGSSNIVVRHLGIAGIPNTPSAASVGTSSIINGSITTAKFASGAITSGLLPAGTVLQVVSMRTNTAISWSNTEQSTGLTLSITPSSASNKVLVIANCNGMESYTTNSGITYTLYRNGTGIYNIGAYYGYPNAAYGAGAQTSLLDSPATTSSVTYDVRFQRTLGSGGGVINGDASNSFLTLLEIAG